MAPGCGGAGQDTGSAVTGTTILKIVTCYRDLARQAAPGCRFIPAVNKADKQELLGKAREIAGRLSQSMERVLVTSTVLGDPVLEVLAMISAVILAAGLSTRLGRPKQLLQLGSKTILEHVLDHVSRARVVGSSSSWAPTGRNRAGNAWLSCAARLQPAVRLRARELGGGRGSRREPRSQGHPVPGWRPAPDPA